MSKKPTSPKTAPKARTIAANAGTTQVKSEPAPEKEKGAKAQPPALVSVKAGALQTDVGPTVIRIMSAADDAQDKIKELTGQSNFYRAEAVNRLTMGIYNAVKADDEIDIYDVFGSTGAWKKVVAKIYVALGVKTPEGKWTPVFAEQFHNQNAGEAERESAEYKKRENRANNFATQVKKAAQAVCGLIDTKSTPTWDDKNKVLVVQNAPKAIAGKAKGTIALDGFSTAKGAEEKAAVAAFANMAKRQHSEAKPGKGKASATDAKATAAVLDEADFGELINTTIGAINSLEGTFTPAQRKLCEALWTTVKNALETGRDVESAQGAKKT